MELELVGSWHIERVVFDGGGSLTDHEVVAMHADDDDDDPILVAVQQ